MMGIIHDSIWDLLKATSRSFYLTLRVTVSLRRSIPKRQGTAAVQDASRHFLSLANLRQVLECASPLTLFPCAYGNQHTPLQAT